MILGKRDNEMVEQLKQDRLDAIGEAKKYKKLYESTKNELESTNEKLELSDRHNKAKDIKIRDLMFIDYDKFAEMNDITFKELASILNISVSTLNKYRKDPTDMTPDRHKDILSKLLQYKSKNTR